MSELLGMAFLATIVGGFMFLIVGWFVWAIQTNGWLIWFLEFGSWERIDKRYERRGVEKTLLRGELKEVEENFNEMFLRKLQQSEDSWAKHCRERAYERSEGKNKNGKSKSKQESMEKVNAKSID